MRSKAYCINIAPISWKRAGKSLNRIYDTQTREKLDFAFYMQAQHGSEPLFKKAIALDVIFYMRRPNSGKSLTKRYHSSYPDIDNLCKFLFDSMKNVLIVDDRLICSLSTRKLYDNNPRTEFTITEVE